MLRKRRVDLRALDTEIEGYQGNEPPWPYERLVLHFRVTCERLSTGVLERVIRLSVVRYCSVIATMRGVAQVDATMELVTPAGDSTGRLPVRLDVKVVEAAGTQPAVGDEAEPSGDEA